jgi:hypothetical protein
MMRQIGVMTMTNYRIRFIEDPDAQFEECNGESRPLTAEEYADNEYMKDGLPVSYASYLAYYGNPDRHVYLMSEVQKQCECCKHWQTVGGTGHIDFMDDSLEIRYTDTWYSPDQITDKMGYLQEIALQDLEEARHAD